MSHVLPMARNPHSQGGRPPSPTSTWPGPTPTWGSPVRSSTRWRSSSGKSLRTSGSRRRTWSDSMHVEGQNISKQKEVTYAITSRGWGSLPEAGEVGRRLVLGPLQGLESGHFSSCSQEGDGRVVGRDIAGCCGVPKPLHEGLGLRHPSILCPGEGKEREERNVLRLPGEGVLKDGCRLSGPSFLDQRRRSADRSHGRRRRPRWSVT